MSSVFRDILIEFQGKADGLASAISHTKSSTSVDSGEQREISLLKMIEHHIPSRSGIHRGGYIFDSNENKSKQIDNSLSVQDMVEHLQYTIDLGIPDMNHYEHMKVHKEQAITMGEYFIRKIITVGTGASSNGASGCSSVRSGSVRRS